MEEEQLESLTLKDDESQTSKMAGGSSATLINDSSNTDSIFKVGVREDRNKAYRRTMEDSHAEFVCYGGLKNQGYFAIFDGHAGKAAAKWCGENLHTWQVLLEEIENNKENTMPEILNKAFMKADEALDEKNGFKSGCTAVVSVFRDEEIQLPDSTTKVIRKLYCANAGDARAVLCRDGYTHKLIEITFRIAIRLTYDHKGTDKQESKRVTELGGYMIQNRVNGVLAVTRALGDASMKELVSGCPYTTEIEINDKDEFLILACDGLWDVCEDQNAVDLVNEISDPEVAAQTLVDFALNANTTDNLTVMVVKICPEKKQ